ncbi:hypothetical protein EYF80_001814 [Liparis tanakae]|uniref:Uncharacterized protein n=1 Tax=Liparis tanakae TaxID=230148 RepID=A0A4Z2JCF9_9TELE|nr:hypothetical protein EYF80_001814 [Liparis tanakae]
MAPAPLPSLQASAARTASVVVERRGALVLYVRVKVVEAPGQLGQHWRVFSGARGPEQPAQPGGVELVHRRLSEGRRRGQRRTSGVTTDRIRVVTEEFHRFRLQSRHRLVVAMVEAREKWAAFPCRGGADRRSDISTVLSPSATMAVLILHLYITVSLWVFFYKPC